MDPLESPRAAAFGGTTTIIDFAVQYKGQALNEALDVWFKKAEGKATIDYGFHMILTDLPDHRLSEIKGLINQGVTSFKLFMAYPGVFLVDDGTIFKAMTTTSDGGGLVCMHAENCVVIDVLVKRALAEGKTGPTLEGASRQ
jgi:dihydropyrimidinase